MMELVRAQTADVPATLTVPARASLLYVEEGFVQMPRARSTTVQLEPESHLVYSWNAVSSKDSLRAVTFLLGPGASLDFYGVVIGRDAGALQLKLHIDHTGRASRSRAVLRSLVQDAAKINVAGLIAIQPEAHQADAYLESRSILLSKEARSNIVPSLEIAARDVKAGHAAATGPIDPEQIFYLASRGFPEAQAQRLIIRGFVEGLLQRLPREETQALLTARWQEYLTPHL